ncbi:uncharacterized protein LOC128736377 [Sabethes cyaneus]|uniref:uncharacterized protein LOC128736377 n=1 Tax=Sabethes cyaneus TaxID=53552 RepID=UPI00237DE817|nr:uncharacterized protein LOC128736377 [Sabethes cyaneus]
MGVQCLILHWHSESPKTYPFGWLRTTARCSAISTIDAAGMPSIPMTADTIAHRTQSIRGDDSSGHHCQELYDGRSECWNMQCDILFQAYSTPTMGTMVFLQSTEGTVEESNDDFFSKFQFALIVSLGRDKASRVKGESLDFTDGLYRPNLWPTETPKPQQPKPEPYFVTSASKNATVRQGDPVFLSCTVENLGSYTVSWIRHNDLHILTVDRYTYTADQRFQALHNNETAEWILNIKWTERKDTGIYECQVSTLPVKSLPLYLIVLDEFDLVRRQDDILYDLPIPPSLSETIKTHTGGNGYGTSSVSNQNGDIYNRMYADRDYLNLAATTQILEGTIVYAYKGENLNLTCIVNHNYDRRPSHVIWYHQNDIVSYESLRKRDKSPPNSITLHHQIQNVDFDDAGNYTCAPELYGSASTIVYILDGDEVQGAITSNGGSGNPRVTTLTVTVAIILSLCIFYYHPDKAG